MDMLTILELALEGARKRVSYAAHDCYQYSCRDDKNVQRLKDSIREHDEIKALVQKEKNSHTMELDGVMELVQRLGYDWNEQEAESFLKYSQEKGRIGNWEYAALKWEEHRKKHSALR